MGGSDGKIVYKIEGDNSKYKESIEDVKKIAKVAGDTMKGIFAGTTALIGAVMAGTISLIKNVATAYGEYEQLVGGIESMFGATEKGIAEANRVLAMGDQAWKNLTMSESQYYTQFMATYPLINATISKGGDAIAETNKLLELSSDLANTFGYSIETAMNAINWALKGNYSYIDNLNIGIKGTKEGFLEAVNASGLFADEIKDISQLTSEQIVQVLQYQANIYGVLGKTQAEAEKTLQGSFKMLSASWANFVTALGKDSDEIEKRLDEVMYAFDKVLNNIVPLINRVIGHLPTAISKIVDTLVILAPTLIRTAFNIFESVMDIIFKHLSDVMKLISSVLMQVARLVINYAPQFVQAVVDTFKLIVSELSSNFLEIYNRVSNAILEIVDILMKSAPDILRGIAYIIIELARRIPDFIDELMQIVLNNFPIIFNALMEIAMAIAQMLPQMVIQIVNRLPDIINMISDALIQCAPVLIQAVIVIMENISIAVLAGVGALVMQIPELLEQMWNGLLDMFMQMGQAIVARLQHEFDNLRIIWESFVDFIKFCGNQIAQFFVSVANKMYQIGYNIVTGIYQGFVSAWERMVARIRAMVNSLVSTVKNALRISSPSKLFADEVGAMIPKGIAVGVEKSEGEAQQAVRGMTESLVGAGANVGVAMSPVSTSSADYQGLMQSLSESLGNIKVENEIYLDGMSMARRLYDYQQKVKVERGQNFVPIY